MAGIPVAIIMGSQSDWATMRHAAETLDGLGVAYDARIISAHRTPDRLVAFARGARAEGFQVVIAGAGGAAHLPGMAAALTPLPVFGVPVESKAKFAESRGEIASIRLPSKGPRSIISPLARALKRNGPSGSFSMNELAELEAELARLKQEHRDLDTAIDALESMIAGDQLQVQRLKKRKLALKDQIIRLEDQLTPDIIA